MFPKVRLMRWSTSLNICKNLYKLVSIFCQRLIRNWTTLTWCSNCATSVAMRFKEFVRNCAVFVTLSAVSWCFAASASWVSLTSILWSIEVKLSCTSASLRSDTPNLDIVMEKVEIVMIRQMATEVATTRTNLINSRFLSDALKSIHKKQDQLLTQKFARLKSTYDSFLPVSTNL